MAFAGFFEGRGSNGFGVGYRHVDPMLAHVVCTG